MRMTALVFYCITKTGIIGNQHAITQKGTENATHIDDPDDDDDDERWKADVYTPPILILPANPPGRINPGDAKVSDHFSDSYTLGNGWDEGNKFKLEVEVGVWAQNGEKDAEAKQCKDRASHRLKL